jgi:hypothetical protein
VSIGERFSASPATLHTMMPSAWRLTVMATLIAGAGCDRGTLPGSQPTADARIEADVTPDHSPQNDGSATDAGADSSCPKVCGRVASTAMRVDASCVFLIPCPRVGDFIDLAVIVDSRSIPRSPSEGWDYTDATMSAFELHGQVCTDLMSGAAMMVTANYTCPLP